MIGRKLLALLIFVGFSLTAADSGADDLQPTKLYLVMSMAGVTAGSLKLSIDPVDEQVDTSLKMKSQGFFKFLTGYKSRSSARSSLGAENGGPMPLTFGSSYETKKTDRKVEIRYDPADGSITGLETWKRGKSRKSKVPEALRVDTADPLTAVLQLRHWIREIRAEGGGGQAREADEEARAVRTFEIFDGRRRYRLEAELLDRRQITFDREKRPVLRFKVLMEPLAGFSKKDMLANWASEDGKRWIELIVTDDDNPIPVSLTTKGGTLETTVYLRKVCIGEKKCRKVDG